MRELFYIAKCCHQTIHIVCSCFGLRSASGNSGAQTGRRLERSRSATPPPSRRRKHAAVAANTIAARDERVVLRSGTGMVERVKGRPKARAAQQSARWSWRLKSFGWTGIVPASEADSVCEQLGMDGRRRCGSVSAADERPQQPHFAH